MDLQIDEKTRTFRVIWQTGDETKDAVVCFHPLYPFKEIRDGKLELTEIKGDMDTKKLVRYTRNPQYEKMPELPQTTYQIDLEMHNGAIVPEVQKKVCLTTKYKIFQKTDRSYSGKMVKQEIQSEILIPAEFFWFAFTKKTCMEERFYLPPMTRAGDRMFTTWCLLDKNADKNKRLTLCLDERIQDMITVD